MNIERKKKQFVCVGESTKPSICVTLLTRRRHTNQCAINVNKCQKTVHRTHAFDCIVAHAYAFAICLSGWLCAGLCVRVFESVEFLRVRKDFLLHWITTIDVRYQLGLECITTIQIVNINRPHRKLKTDVVLANLSIESILHGALSFFILLNYYRSNEITICSTRLGQDEDRLKFAFEIRMLFLTSKMFIFTDQ